MIRKYYSLVFMTHKGKLLLGYKYKEGSIGQGTLTGFGGKLEPEKDADMLACAMREMQEEVGIRLFEKQLEHRGELVINLGFVPKPDYIDIVHVFTGQLTDQQYTEIRDQRENLNGEIYPVLIPFGQLLPQELKPNWDWETQPIVPYQYMPLNYRYGDWLGKILQGHSIIAKFLQWKVVQSTDDEFSVELNPKIA